MSAPLAWQAGGELKNCEYILWNQIRLNKLFEPIAQDWEGWWLCSDNASRLPFWTRMKMIFWIMIEIVIPPCGLIPEFLDQICDHFIFSVIYLILIVDTICNDRIIFDLFDVSRRPVSVGFKLVHIVASSELHESWWNNHVFFKIIPSHFCRASEASKIDCFKN